MQQNSTPELLVKHLYNETNATEAKSVQNSMESNPSLQQEFKSLQEAKYRLDETDGDEPGKSAISNILAYSKEMSAETV